MIGVLSYFSYAVSSSIDKYMMNNERDAIATNTVKSFLDGTILLLIAFILGTKFDPKILPFAIGLGGLYAASGILYFKLMQQMNAETVIPVKQSSNILLVFSFSVILLSETVNHLNVLGAFFSSASAFIILKQEKLGMENFGKGVHLLVASLIITLIYSLLAKLFLSDFKAITLAASMYFSATVFQLLFQKHRGKLDEIRKIPDSGQLPTVTAAAVFGALGTFLLYTALKLGDASEVYPLAGAQSAFIFLIATFFLKEEFNWKRMIGLVTAIIGIYLIQI